MKTQVIIISSYQHSQIPVAETAYIDGYVQGADNRPYAVIVWGDIIDMDPLSAIKPIGLIGI